MDANLAASPFDEVPLLYVRAQASSAIARAPTCRLHDNRVDLKRRPPKSRPTAVPPVGPLLSRPSVESQSAGTPPSTFLFLPIHLSNSPEPRGSTHQQAGGPPKPHASDGKSEAWSPNISEVLRRRVIAPERRTACREGLYRLAAYPLSTDPRPKNRGLRLSLTQARGGRGPAASQRARGTGNCAGGGVTPYCGHIPRPFFASWWEVSVRGFICARVV